MCRLQAAARAAFGERGGEQRTLQAGKDVDAVLEAAGQGRRRPASGPSGLTAREVEVLVLIARGASNKQVAAFLGITPKTAGTHIERIYAKIGASTRSTAPPVKCSPGWCRWSSRRCRASSPPS